MSGFFRWKWTKNSLRRHALAYLRVDRLPRGLAKELVAFQGTDAYVEPINHLLARWRKPWIGL